MGWKIVLCSDDYTVDSPIPRFIPLDSSKEEIL